MKLTDAEIAERLERLKNWSREGDEIRRTFKLRSFPDAIGFVTRVGFLAESAGHHPDIDIRYKRVTLALTTHDAGGLTEKDFALAAQIDGVLP
ncbi:MAG TPA: 4a-hydroxytetrahydrobiopterin dehydratase [Roseiflexaceae bacterium]|nr:4a-hydroxytetrahydrobiopterin dehydratase [Roseiflexaceae bacterium]